MPVGGGADLQSMSIYSQGMPRGAYQVAAWCRQRARRAERHRRSSPLSCWGVWGAMPRADIAGKEGGGGIALLLWSGFRGLFRGLPWWLLEGGKGGGERW